MSLVSEKRLLSLKGFREADRSTNGTELIVDDLNICSVHFLQVSLPWVLATTDIGVPDLLPTPGWQDIILAYLGLSLNVWDIC